MKKLLLVFLSFCGFLQAGEVVIDNNQLMIAFNAGVYLAKQKEIVDFKTAKTALSNMFQDLEVSDSFNNYFLIQNKFADLNACFDFIEKSEEASQAFVSFLASFQQIHFIFLDSFEATFDNWLQMMNYIFMVVANQDNLEDQDKYVMALVTYSSNALFELETALGSV